MVRRFYRQLGQALAVRLRLVAELVSAITLALVRKSPADADRIHVRRQIRVDMEGERRLHIRYLNPNADYAKVDCFIAEARRVRLDLGFVGNEAPSSN
jgi:hypothetical protein